MKTRYFRWPLLAMVIAAVVVFIGAPPTSIGLSTHEYNGNYHIAGGAQPWLLVLASLFAGCYTALMYSENSQPGPPMRRVRLRYVAFCIDFFMAVLIMGSAIGVVAVIAEWQRTGRFQWQFERTSYAPGDSSLDFATLLISIVILVGYFSIPLVRRKPTPGSCIFGYRVLLDDGSAFTTTAAVQRTFFGLVAVGRGMSSLLKRQPEDFWLDEKFGTTAFKL